MFPKIWHFSVNSYCLWYVIVVHVSHEKRGKFYFLVVTLKCFRADLLWTDLSPSSFLGCLSSVPHSLGQHLLFWCLCDGESLFSLLIYHFRGHRGSCRLVEASWPNSNSSCKQLFKLNLSQFWYQDWKSVCVFWFRHLSDFTRKMQTNAQGFARVSEYFV